MGSEIRRIQRRRKALRQLRDLAERDNNVLLIHYSCESFYDRPEGRTPRVTSIAVRNFASGQTDSFSIHKVAEQQGVPFADIEKQYDELEKEMLGEFFDLVKRREGHTWVHWNMRDINYGFSAIEHRFRVLGGEPVEIDEARKVDLSRALVALYGTGYIGHPRLANLIERNRITNRDFLTGQEEANAFDAKDYVKLHQSTLRKADILANILGRTVDGTLKTNARWWEVHGVNPKVIGELIQEHWIVSVLGFLAILATLYGALRNAF